MPDPKHVNTHGESASQMTSGDHELALSSLEVALDGVFLLSAGKFIVAPHPWTKRAPNEAGHEKLAFVALGGTKAGILAFAAFICNRGRWVAGNHARTYRSYRRRNSAKERRQ